MKLIKIRCLTCCSEDGPWDVPKFEVESLTEALLHLTEHGTHHRLVIIEPENEYRIVRD